MLLWVQPSGTGVPNQLEASYVRKVGDKLQPFVSILTIVPHREESSSTPSTEDDSSITAKEILSRAYPDSKPGASILVLVNPHGGKGDAMKIFRSEVEPILEAAHCEFTVMKTAYSGHASDIAEQMDIDKYDLVLCASGDGIPHEVINGLYRREDRAKAFDKLIITETPSGSGNAMALSCLGTLVPSTATLEILKGSTVRNDLMAVYSQREPVKLSFLSQTYGIVAQADIGTEWMRWMGEVRFQLGLITQLAFRASYPCTIAVKYIAKTKDELSEYYRHHVNDSFNMGSLTDEGFRLKYYDQFLDADDISDFSAMDGWEELDSDACENMGIFYSGKMPYVSKDTNFFPAALPNDGSIDIVVTDSRSGFFRTLDALMSLDKGLHVWNEDVAHFKVEAFRVIPRPKPGKHPYISVDGENFKLQPFQVEIMKGVLKTVMQGGSYTETGFLDKT
ncbi:DEKNAAC103690 [Brettanomyces naardenensis]|uniref:DEKNAAC103690 n=1 Tax=Brettanomyces naardenensis TaxID=13370 RepID=A0A448YNR6_BRENA|nr:DEKNAAC103690 [Brettanomyces naardenensis]